MMRRLLPLLVLLATACGGGSSPGPTHVTLVLDWIPNPDHVGVYAAMDRGFFSHRGITVTARPPSDVSSPIQLVAAGRADVGISYESELFFAQERHIPVAAVATVVPTALASIIAAGGEGISTPADLRGKTIGVDGTQSTDAFVKTVLGRSGVDPADVDMKDVGFNQVPALLGHKVDAVAGVYQNIEGVQFAMHGLHPVVFPYDHYGVPPYDELVVVANRDRLGSDSDYRAAVRRFVAGLAAGTAWAKRHPQDAIAVMRRHSAADYRNILERSVPVTLRLLGVEAPSRAAWERFGTWMSSSGLLDEKPDAAALIARP